MSDEHEFDIEPVPGLPADLPEDEKLLWQGEPGIWPLARDVLRIWWLVGYLALLASIRIVALPVKSADAILPIVVLFGIMSLLIVGIILISAMIIKRTTVYTITTKRVAMRIGAMVNVTLNLPFAKIGSMDMDLRKDGSGSIVLSLMGRTRLSYLMCWPHVRPFYISNTKPALRAIPNAQEVADILSEAAQARVVQLHNNRVIEPAHGAEVTS
ncbi:MAG: photosynthetic complex putative assembly protein PuhB [Pseudomonadota bacterium]